MEPAAAGIGVPVSRVSAFAPAGVAAPPFTDANNVWKVTLVLARTKRTFGSISVVPAAEQLVLPVYVCQLGGSQVDGWLGWATLPNSSLRLTTPVPNDVVAPATAFVAQ